MGSLFQSIAQIGLGFIGSMSEQQAVQDQYDEQRKEFERQQEEANLRAREERSDRVRERDKAAAAAMVAFEAIGGAGSQNAARRQQEVAGTAAIDLSRISGNQRRELSSIYSRAKAARKDAATQIASSQQQFLGSALNIGFEALNAKPTHNAESEGGGASDFTPEGGSMSGSFR